MIKAFNKKRKEVIVPGWLTCIDESMVGWTGNGMPHQSFTPRKPEPLGCGIKNTCDAMTGCMLFLEIQVRPPPPFHFAKIAWPTFVEVSFVVREENKLFVLFTCNKTNFHDCRPSFFFGFFFNPFMRDSFCHCALARPVPPALVPGQQDNDGQKEARAFFAPPLSCLFPDLPITKGTDNNILPLLPPR
jgi:hypothetical protein